MTDKAYIVANKKQELCVLNKFEEKGLIWVTGKKPTDLVQSESFLLNGVQFPYVLIEGEDISWLFMTQLTDETIVFDGRNKDEEVYTRYKVTQKFMNELKQWRNDNGLETKTEYMYEAVDGDDIQRIPDVVDIWWTDPNNSIERNNRLITIIQWLNGEDVFEVETPHKFVVRSEHADKHVDYNYVKVVDHIALSTDFRYAMKFDTREEAQEWANSHQVVVEIDEEGNEVQ
nr:MAG TPA: hypothetical protein [Caudoviricetes sp.]